MAVATAADIAGRAAASIAAVAVCTAAVAVSTAAVVVFAAAVAVPVAAEALTVAAGTPAVAATAVVVGMAEAIGKTLSSVQLFTLGAELPAPHGPQAPVLVPKLPFFPCLLRLALPILRRQLLASEKF